MTRADKRGIERAMKAALVSHLRVRVGASCGYFLGWNRRQTHPKLKEWGCEGWTVHAEVAVVLGLGFPGLEGETVYVARLLRNGEAALAKPCAACMRLLASARVKRVVWTEGNEAYGEVRL